MDHTTTRPAAPGLEVLASRHFPAWLAEQRVSLARTTYESGKVLLMGVGAEGRLAVCERTFDRCTGLCADADALWVSTAFQVWRFEAAPEGGEDAEGYDRVYVPRAGITTGDADVHDVALDGSHRTVLVSTLLSCLATPDPRHGLEVLWRPPFVSRLAAEDRCHLNGLAVVEGRPRFVTACGATDVVNGWRDRRRDGGCVVNVEANAVALAGLSMPHSPRWHRDRLWLLNSGTGDFGCADLAQGRFEPVAFCPGFARGLAFVGDYAVVGLCRPREATFRGLALDANLTSRGAMPWCGLQVIDLRSGDAIHWVRIDGPVTELYDIAVLPGVIRPRLLGFRNGKARCMLWARERDAVRHWHAISSK